MKGIIGTLTRSFGPMRPVLNHDPAQTAKLGVVVAAGLIAVGLWGLYGDLLFSNIVVVFGVELMLLAYVPGVVAMASRLVRDFDRWQVESALTFRQMMAENKGAGISFQAGSPLYHRQLELQLTDGLTLAGLYGTPLSLLAMRLEMPGHQPSHAIFASANVDVAALAHAHPELLGGVAAVGMFEWVFPLTGHDRKAAMGVSRFLERELKRYRCFFGLSVFPEDAAQADDLLRSATAQCGVIRDTAA